ncbi:MAG: dihydrodipicolinate reductase [Pseudomonadota bacterium]
MRLFTAAALMGLTTALPAVADTVTSQAQFMSIVQGKTLSRAPSIRLQVKPNGTVEGKAISWPVTGEWTWRDGYFCRDLDWGDMDIGYNCQKVTMDSGNRIRFTSDKGNGDSAAFRLN